MHELRSLLAPLNAAVVSLLIGAVLGVGSGSTQEPGDEIFEASGDDLPYVAKPFNPYEDEAPPVHYRLEKYLMSNYNPKLIPKRRINQTVSVSFSIGLYQIVEVNEPQQYILMNAWIVEEIVLPTESVWIPDTTLYNSLVMDDAESRRVLTVKVTAKPEKKASLVELLYPTLLKFSCMLDLRFFPFDVQHCKMTFGSWTYDNKGIDYYPQNKSGDGAIGTEYCIENEAWNILSTDVMRRVEKFKCCPNNYTLLDFYLHIQRKPLFYLVNLIVPTSVITLIAIVGFFSSSTMNDVREEKISLGITTLLSMSILIFMVSDQMPSTSSFIPLIGWFYTSMMILISCGTLAASFVIYVQKKGIVGQRPSSRVMWWARKLGTLIMIEMPLLMKQAYALKAKQEKIRKQNTHRKLSMWQRMQQVGRGISFPRRPTSTSAPSTMVSFIAPSSTTETATFSSPNNHPTGHTVGGVRDSMSVSFNADLPRRREQDGPTTLSLTTSTNLDDIKFIDEDVESDFDDDEKTEWDVAPTPTLGHSHSLPNGSALGVNNDSRSPANGNTLSPAYALKRPGTLMRRTPSALSTDLYGQYERPPMGSVSPTLQQRNLAEIEYDWLAAVIERLFLILFISLFFLMSFGINGIGLYYWYFTTVDKIDE
ncbi:ACR-23-like protein [Aphelenchoides avenae]|nr:ACR-23-like protein [Aphelenchus avenae]